MKTVTTCLVPGCGKAAVVRGLCACCYTTAQRLIKLGEVSEDALVRSGRMLKSARSGGAAAFFRAAK